MGGYYSQRLSAERLRLCYELAPPRVQQYLQAEVDYVKERIQDSDRVLELGCGYGRVVKQLARKARFVIGVDTSLASLRLGLEILGNISNYCILNMDAVYLGFSDRVFDKVVCIQNGISAFHVDQKELIRESIRVTKRDGTVLFSSYSNRFWKERLEWFELQSEAGLLGEIDYEKTCNGAIMCKDGFTATTVQPDQFRLLTEGFSVDAQIEEVDGSSLFCQITTY